MSAERFNDDLRDLVPGMRIRQAVTAARLNALTTLARDANRGSMIRGGPGLRVSSGPQGVTVRARKPLPKPAAVRKLPLQVYLKSAGEGFEAYVVASTVLGEVPKIGDPPTALNAATPPFLSVPGTGTRHVILNINLSPTVTSGFVLPIVNVTSITITLVETAPGAGDLLSSSGVYKHFLATIVDGEITLQAGFGPIAGELCDTLDGSGTAGLLLTWGDYAS
jgi:hypothetical protein